MSKKKLLIIGCATSALVTTIITILAILIIIFVMHRINDPSTTKILNTSKIKTQATNNIDTKNNNDVTKHKTVKFTIETANDKKEKILLANLSTAEKRVRYFYFYTRYAPQRIAEETLSSLKDQEKFTFAPDYVFNPYDKTLPAFSTKCGPGTVAIKTNKDGVIFITGYDNNKSIIKQITINPPDINSEEYKNGITRGNLSTAVSLVRGLLGEKYPPKIAVKKTIEMLNNKGTSNTSSYDKKLPAFGSKPGPGVVTIICINNQSIQLTAYDKNLNNFINKTIYLPTEH